MPMAVTAGEASSRRNPSTNEMRTADGVAAAGRWPSAAIAAAGVATDARIPWISWITWISAMPSVRCMAPPAWRLWKGLAAMGSSGLVL